MRNPTLLRHIPRKKFRKRRRENAGGDSFRRSSPQTPFRQILIISGLSLSYIIKKFLKRGRGTTFLKKFSPVYQYSFSVIYFVVCHREVGHHAVALCAHGTLDFKVGVVNGMADFCDL